MPDGRRGRRCAEAGRRGAGTGRCRRCDPGDRTDPEFRSSSRTGRSPSSSWITSLHSHPSELQRRARRKVVTRTTAPEYNAPHHRGAPPPRAARQPERTCSRSPVAVRQSRAMTTRRDHRPIHVRPRPPSSSRSAPVKVKPRSPGPNRLASHRPIQRGNGLPIVFRLAMAAAIVALGVAVLYVAVGGLGKVAGGIGSTLGGFVTNVTSTPSPRASDLMTGRPALDRAARRAVHERGHRRPRGHRSVRARGRQEPSPAGVPDAPRPAPHGRSRTSPSPTGRRRSSRSS